MRKILQQPYPFISNKKQTLLSDALIGLLIFCILYFAKPFGIVNLSNVLQLKLTVTYGVISFLVAAFYNFILPQFFTSTYNEEDWNVLKEIVQLLLIVVTIAMVNLMVTLFFNNNVFSLKLLFNILLYTVLLAFIPIVIVTIIKQQKLLKKYKNKAALIQEQVNELKTSEPEIVVLEKEQQEITIIGTNAKEKLTISANNFCFAQAADNYCQVYYVETDILKQVLFRTTIKNIESNVQGIDYIFRCHKSYIINLKSVIEISGNAQGYKLHLFNSTHLIPVSRNFNNIIQEKLLKTKK